MTKFKLNKNERLQPLAVFKNNFINFSSISDSGKKIFVRSPLKFNMKVNSILAIIIILIMMISVFASLSTSAPVKPSIVQPVANTTTTSTTSTSPTSEQTTTPTQKPFNTKDSGSSWNPVNIISEIIAPTPRPAGLIESNPTVNGQVWKTIAANAWQYFQPDIGVDRATGLPRASLVFPYFTDWDLGVYIQAIIDANKTGLIGNDGDWGSNARIGKVLNFLETRELNNDSYPFWFYQASDSKDYHSASDLATTAVDAIDTGRLFVALNNLRTFNSSLNDRINNIVLTGRSNYSVLLPSIRDESKTSTSIYLYYIASGYASFWPNELANVPTNILNNINNVQKTGTVTTYGVSLPNATISCEPLLCSVFELNNDPKLMDLAKQVYLAHEARYNATGKYVAFSEGNTLSSFIYEWVVLPNGDTWKIMNAGESTYSNIEPIIFTKVAMSFLAIYNTTFARNMTIYLEKVFPDLVNGYYSGSDYNADINNAHVILSTDSNTNGMILGAARYALKNNP